MCRNILTWLATLSALFAISAIRIEPRIFTRNGHLSIFVDRDRDINLMVSGEGRIKINDEDIVRLINSVKNVSILMNSFTKPTVPWSTNINNNDIVLTPTFFQRIDNLEQDLNNHTGDAKLEFMRIRRRLSAIQRNVRSMMMNLATNECAPTPCANGATCQDLYKSFICICPAGWEGTLCDKDVNECARFAGTDLGCQNGATCTNKPGSYECVCPVGFFGTHCTTKTVDCYAAGKDLCGHGSCMPQAVGYKCFCDQGWTTDGKNLACTVDVNECDSKRLPCSTNPLVECINVPGSFYCGHCPPGYSGNGYYCNDIDECQVFNGGCSMNPIVQCINTPGSRMCGLCPPGFVGNGVTCSYQGSVCNVNNGGCNPLAQCRDNPRISSSYVECICPRGYIGNGVGPAGCVQSATTPDPCNPNPCVFGTCSIRNVTNDYVCFCRLKYTGRNCDIKKDACLSNPCQNGGTCVDLFGLSYRCRCTPQFVGINCQTEKQLCGGKLESLDGLLQFPLDPNQKYNHGLSCAWVIQTNSTKVLNITFTKFDIEDSSECQYDWIQIHDGRNSAAHNIGRFCGSKLPKGGNIITTTNLVYIWFRSDTRLAKGGFALNWTTIDPVCGGTIAATGYGIIKSPGYPGNYPLNRDCYWRITTSRENRIEFHFFTLVIGQDTNCTGDFLEFYYDVVKPDSRFAQYCTTTHPAPLTSPSHNVIVYFHSNNKLTYSGFQLSFHVISGIPSCGGTFTTRTGQINSPVVSFSSLESQYLECEYKISVENQLRVKIEFLTLNLFKYGRYCSEHVSVYDGPTKESPLIGKYCGSTIPAPFLSLGNELLIVYYGKRPNTFTLKYETVCGRKYTAPTGTIMSAHYPQLTESNIQCLYEIQQLPGSFISLTIVDFSSRLLLFRKPGAIEVRDGNSKEATLLGRYTPFASYPVTISSTHNYMTIAVTYAGWLYSKRKYYMNYTVEDAACGGIHVNDLGTIKSPNHPGIYPTEANCVWVIQAPAKHVVQLTFLNFKLEQSHSCGYDSVTVFDVNDKSEDGGLIGKFCGAKLPPTLLSTSNVMRVIFKTDSSYSSDGFLATYVFISEENVCGGSYFTSAGAIKSPRYPNPYPVNRDCKWIIHVQPGRQIMLNVTDFQLEAYSKCRYDYLEIRNGGTAASPLIGRYCGTTIPSTISSHANQLFIHFKTDMTRNAKGFMIYWSSTSTGCGGLLTSPRGSIISPHYPEPYSKNTECYWKISINAGSVIQIVFADLDLEPHLICYLDYVEIFDGKDLSAKSLGRFCSNHPPFLRSTFNHMLIKFRSDVSFQGRGFQIQYSTVCENTINGYAGVIESPNFPNRYPQNEDCTWTIGVTSGNKINITFSHFELERSISYSPEKCRFDYVELIYTDYGTEEQVKKMFCGDDIPPPVTINSNTTKVHFVSDHLLMGNGFRLEWQIVGCGGILTHPSGSFHSPNYPSHYPPSTTCDWVIQTTYGNSIVVTFEQLDIEPASSCHYDMIQVYNGPDDKSHLMNELCHTNGPTTVTGSGSSMLVRFQSDSSYEGTGFQATYQSVLSKCGGTLRANQGEFTSPNYPKNYDAGTFCEWLIEIEVHHVIELRFIDVDLVQGINVSYIKVYDGPSSAYPMIALLRGDKAPNDTIRSTYNHLFVEMMTSGSMTSKGFKASYATACGALLDSETNGVINYNPHQSFYADTCQWTIVAQDSSQHVSFTLSQVKGYYCDFDIHWISIYNGFNVSAPLIGTYCQSLPHMITSTGSMLHIAANMGFKASYSTLNTACGGSLEGERGYFASPNFPNNYPVDIECEWTVNISDSMTTSITFESFELVDSEHCNDDFLEIRANGDNGDLLGLFCGNNAPVNITNVGRIWIFFKSSKPEDGEITTTAKGFKAEYLLLKHTDLTAPSGTIYSPLYPQYYTKNDYFSWRITIKFGYRIAIKILDLAMSYGSDDFCYSASLSFYDGYDIDAPLLHQLCSFSTTSFKSTSNVMYIEASMDITRRGARFAFDWLQVEDVKNTTIQPTSTCGSTEMINIQPLRNYTLESPGYPYGYNHSLSCDWIFSTIPENHLQIDFYLVDLEYRIPCVFDRIEVYSGRNGVEDWELLNTICLPNDTFRATIDSTNLMKVAFKTDSYLNRTGFSAMITEACGGAVQKSNGIISVTNATFSHMYSLDCQWNISVRSGRTMKVSFQWFDLGKNADLKCNNYILLRNGNSASSPTLGDGKYCGENGPPTLTTTSNHLYIKFSTQTKVRGFSMKYDEVSVDCGGRITLSDMANVTTISSPNYPNIPLPHTECMWLISAVAGESIQIDFVDRFDLTDALDCVKEYVEIRNGGTIMSPLIGRYCESKPSTITTRDNMVFIKFFTDVDEPRNGFKIQASIAKCGGTIRDSTGEIKSRYFDRKKRNSKKENCTWEIEGPDGYFTILNFKTLDLGPYTDSCTSDYVEILEHSIIDYNNVTSVGKYCKNTVEEIRTTSNKIRVRYVSTDRNSQIMGFHLEFKTSKEKCGGSMDSDFGYITSPNYPVMFPTRCEWIIRVTKGRRITVEILDLDFDTTQPSQGLAFSNADNFASHITFITLNDNVKFINSTDNTMSVFFWSLYPSNHRGFKLKYSSDEPSVCIGDFSAASGVIHSPENLTYYYCSWTRMDENTTARTLVLKISVNADSDWSTSPTSCKYALSLSVIAGGQDLLLGQFCTKKYTVVRNPYPTTEIVAYHQTARGSSNFTVQYDSYPCGGIVNSNDGTISSPGFPKKTSDLIDCAWLIELTSEQTIKIKFDTLELGDDCAKSYVAIYNGRFSTSPRLGKYCKNTYPQTLQSQHNSLWIEYHSETTAGKGFKLSYEGISTGCGGIYHDTSKIIQSPSYPEDYPNNAECIWEVRSETGYHIGLEFIDRFHIEKTDGCKNDFVEAWDYKDDAWSSLGRLCGREKPNYLNSSSTQMKIMFRSNEKSSGTGFKAKWVLNCGGNFTATPNKQYIRSPGYPENYEDNLDCWYNITSPGNHIIINFEEFELEMGIPNCPYDSVTASFNVHGAIQSKTYCGKTLPPELHAKEAISIRFKTDLFIRRSGFVFSFVTDACGQDVRSPMDISSPTNFMATVSIFARIYRCFWNITAPPDKVIAVKFDKIYTEDSRYCWYNYISLFDGKNASTEYRLAKLCGNMTNKVPTIKSTKNQMILEYRSYNAKQNVFKASIYFTYGPSSGCGGNMVLDTMNKKYIETPNVRGLVDCQWIIEAPEDYYINVEVQKLPPCLETGLNTSRRLEIRSGASHFSELIADICKAQGTKSFSTTGSTAFIQWFTIDNRSGHDKFILELSVVKSKCGNTTLMATEEIKYLSSPNYPDSYPIDTKCVWKINSSSVYRHLFLKLVEFDLGSNDGVTDECIGDRLEIVDRDNRQVIDEGLGSETVYYFGKRGVQHKARRGPLGIHRYCGQSSALAFDYYSGEGNVIVSFYTGSGTHGKGFKLEYSAVGGCRNYTAEQGRLYSNNITDCDFIISVPENKTISLYFVHFGISSRVTGCGDAKMEIYDGKTKDATKLGTFCGFGLPDPVFSTGNNLFIILKKPRYAFANYDVTYTSTSEGRGCGGKIYNYKGRFTSPLYPANYRDVSHCTWEVTVPLGLRLSLKFTVFDIKASCYTDYVTVTSYNDDSTDVQNLCETDTIPVFESINMIKVEYVTSFNNGGTGWVAEFRAFTDDQTIKW